MPKLDLTIRSSLAFLLSTAFMFLDVAASGQTAPGPTAAPPQSGPKDLLLLAGRTSNLTSEGAKPWHMKVSFTIYKEDGSIEDQGLIEEYWASPDRYKLITTGMDFTQTIFETQDGQFRSGKQEFLLATYHDAIAQMTEPIPSPEAVNRTNFNVLEQVNGTAKLSCVEPNGSNSGLLAAYCLSGSPPIARIVVYNGQNGFQAMRNRIQPYQDRFVAGDVIFRKQGKTLLTSHLESIEPLASVDEALFTPSDDAALLILSSKTPLEMINKKPHEYPRIARTAHVQGLVLIQAQVGKDGKPVDLKVIAGPEMLRQACLDAVREWRYRPYLIHGKPVEFITNVPLIFGMADANPAQAPAAPSPCSADDYHGQGSGCSMTTTRSGNMIYVTPPR